ncbi:MAG: hypothetical protein ACYC9L_10925 [Sulfuricaulis sp.]
MSREEHDHLLAERNTLQRILGDIPEEDVLDRSSFLSRLKNVEQRIADTETDSRMPARARLTFRGRPVVGSHGIFAEFGMTATKAFTDAISMMAAALSGPLASSGPIPNREQNQLLITSTAVGSFGFELEEHLDGHLMLESETALSLALTQAQGLLQGSVGSDDELADAATGTDPRALVAVRTFLDTLITNEAVCSVELADSLFSFSDVGEVRRSLERLGQDNLHEELQTYLGEFQGVLPKRRTFEFRVANSEDVITGKIGSGISNADALNQHLHTYARIEVLATRVGNGRPRYVLNKLPDWLLLE